MSCLFSILLIWFPSSAVGNQSGVDTWHRARIVACLLINKIPLSYCSSLQAFMLNFGLCNLLVERWYRSKDGTRRLCVASSLLLSTDTNLFCCLESRISVDYKFKSLDSRKLNP